jgi:hypothetical protein
MDEQITFLPLFCSSSGTRGEQGEKQRELRDVLLQDVSLCSRIPISTPIAGIQRFEALAPHSRAINPFSVRKLNGKVEHGTGSFPSASRAPAKPGIIPCTDASFSAISAVRQWDISGHDKTPIDGKVVDEEV